MQGNAAQDNLHELRALLKRSQEAERLLTAEVSHLIAAHAATRAEGAHAVATLGSQRNTVVDVDLFLEAAGPAGPAACRVSVEAARQIFSSADLAAISETTEMPVLRVTASPKRGA